MASTIVPPRHMPVVRTVAEYRVLTTSQLSHLCFPSEQMVRRCVRDLTGKGILKTTDDRPGRHRGRPELLISVAARGIELLRQNGDISDGTKDEDIVGDTIFGMLDHHLLTNWFRVQIERLSRERPEIAVAYIAPTSPFRSQSPARQASRMGIPSHEGVEGAVSVVPDGVFTLTHRPTGRSLLFFLEVDMATETRVSSERKPTDVRQKLLNYRTCLARGLYKHCQALCEGPLAGFRVLLLANTAEQMASHCRLVRELRPADFIWISEPNVLLRLGAGGKIWSRGGDTRSPPCSILGSLA